MFNSNLVLLSFVSALLTSGATSNVTYYFHSQTTSNSPPITSAQELSTLSDFVPTRQTFFIIHGWEDNYTAEINTLITPALLSRGVYNIIVVDWSTSASKDYYPAADDVPDIGTQVGNFINEMITTYQMNGNQITLIGHSMGAHVAGNAGSIMTSKAYQIIGTDPAGPGFYRYGTSQRLDALDANYVQIIHTNGLFIGWATSLGTADFYPNGGLIQPCGSSDPTDSSCSHERAFQYLAEAISGGSFTSTKCANYFNYSFQWCNSNEKALMGRIDVDSSISGDFYLYTNSAAPYAQG